MQQRLFLKSSLVKNIEVFQLVEYVVWSHEVVSSPDSNRIGVKLRDIHIGGKFAVVLI
jgi:hypothetical protein